MHDESSEPTPGWKDAPWVSRRLKRRSRADALRLARAFALWSFRALRATATEPQAAAAADAFLERLRASATVDALLAFHGPPESVGFVLEQLALAEAERLRGRRFDGTLDAELPDGRWRAALAPKRLRSARRVAQAAAIVADASPALAPELERLQRELRTAREARALLDSFRRRPPRKPLSPEYRVAAAVDMTLGRETPRDVRDRYAAALACEVLGIDAKPERIRELMKPHRRAESRRPPGI